MRTFFYELSSVKNNEDNEDLLKLSELFFLH